MRTLTLISATSLLLASLALPGASAAAAQPCQETYATSLLVQVETHEDCSIEVHLLDTYRLCKWNLDGFEDDRVGTTAGPATASVGYCYPELALSQSMADPGPRPAECPGVATASPYNQYVDVTVRSWGCQVRVTILGGVDCPDGLDGSTGTGQGSTTATAHCTPSAATATAAQPCPVRSAGSGSLRVQTHDCDVYVKVYDCFWGGSYNKKAEAGQFAVYVYECGPIGPPQ